MKCPGCQAELPVLVIKSGSGERRITARMCVCGRETTETERAQVLGAQVLGEGKS